MRTKKIIAMLSSVLVLSSVSTMPALAGGVPVIDVSAIAQAVTQVQNQVSQIQQLDQQIRAMTGNGNYADLMNNPLVRKQLNRYLPRGYNDIFEAARRGDLGALEQVVRQAGERERLAKTSQSGVERYKASQLLKEVQMSEMMKGMNARSQRLEGMVAQINRTQTQAQKQDLLNTISAETAMINLDMNRMQVLMQQAQAEEAKASRQANSEAYKQTQQAQRAYLNKKYPNSLR